MTSRIAMITKFSWLNNNVDFDVQIIGENCETVSSRLFLLQQTVHRSNDEHQKHLRTYTAVSTKNLVDRINYTAKAKNQDSITKFGQRLLPQIPGVRVNFIHRSCRQQIYSSKVALRKCGTIVTVPCCSMQSTPRGSRHYAILHSISLHCSVSAAGKGDLNMFRLPFKKCHEMFISILPNYL